MNILVINCGSSSLKYQLIDMAQDERVLSEGRAERLGDSDPFIKMKFGDSEEMVYFNILTHENAITIILKTLRDKKVIKSLYAIKAVGHRIVHGGFYGEAKIITDEVLNNIIKYGKYAELHNPIAAHCIKVMKKMLPHACHVAVFDTAFHQTIEEPERNFPIPEEYRKNIVRFGAHGTNHQYLAEMMKGVQGEYLKTITFHLGQGCSLSAIDSNGKCKNTTMGLGPLGGAIQGTRSGDLDPTVVCQIMADNGIAPKDMLTVLNKKSGLKAICGYSDFRDIERIAKMQNEQGEKCCIAIKMFCDTIAALAMKMEITLGGAEQYVFSAGIGENDSKIREMICSKLEFTGVQIDKALNEHGSGKMSKISAPDSRVQIFVVPANEELQIARITYALARK